ncbi:hypothetical protein AX17_006802 [Amanita inopinata Kibby_2008]|nr:hypothetical protein AX17_006802 [Amanita inopinata Kibby_2008]
MGMASGLVPGVSCFTQRRGSALMSGQLQLRSSGKRAPLHPAHPTNTSPTTATTTTTTTSDDAPQPQKPRGRKPGPLSRTAREAQRKLNHSIIEKARRTKINEALAELRQLVPAEFGATSPTDSDDDDDDGNGGYGVRQPKKEKEFKLEILERTVAYLKDLTERCGELQKQRQNSGMLGSGTRGRKSDKDGGGESGSADSPRSRKRHRCEPLPPISSWLPLSSPPFLPPSSPLDLPSSGSNKKSNITAMQPSSYLLTPPSSTHFAPLHVPAPISPSSSSSQIPSLTLGPTAVPLPNPTLVKALPKPIACSSSTLTWATTPTPTPLSDKTAASLLLTMRLIHHSPASMPAGTTPPRVVETPGSILGLTGRGGGS